MHDLSVASNHLLSGLARSGWVHRMKRQRGLILSIVVFALLIGSTALVNGRAPSYFGMSMLFASATTLALASIGQTVVVIGGGLDLSIGAIVSFTQAILVVYLTDLGLPVGVLILAAIAVGMAIGAVNGFFIAVVGLQPIIVTLSTMFTLQGLTLLVLPRPGGTVPEPLMALLLDDIIVDILPGPVIFVVAALIVWGVIKNTTLGTGIFAAGSDAHSARLAGLSVRGAQWSSYAIAGGFYGAAGAFVAAQSGGGDPLIGTPLLVSSLTAVMLGGTLLGGGRGSAIGSVFGALTVIAMVSLLLAVGVSGYFSSGIEALVLLFAVIINRPAGSAVESEWRRVVLMLRSGLQRRKFVPQDKPTEFRLPRLSEVLPPEDRKYVFPAWVGLMILVGISAIYFGDRFEPLRFGDRLFVLGAFLSVLVLGQGAVIMSGGFDLSIGWSVTACGVVGAMLMQGSDLALLWAVPIVLLLGAGFGLINGLLVAVVGLSPIVATLAMAGLLQTFTMVISGATPTGDAAPLLRWLVSGKVWGVTPLVVFVLVFVVFGVLFLSNTTFSRRLISVGSNARAALLNGVNVTGVIIAAYVISGLCAALAGLFLTGFLGRASLTMGQSYLLPTVAAVAIGGALITGGRGHYLGLFGGALALTGLQILLSGTPLPPAVRNITLGLSVMLAVISLRERRS